MVGGRGWGAPPKSWGFEEVLMVRSFDRDCVILASPPFSRDQKKNSPACLVGEWE